MSAKDFDIFLSYEDLDRESVLKLARGLVDRRVRVWVPAWELVSDQVPLKILTDAILQSTSVVTCIGAGGRPGDVCLRDTATASANGIQCISVQLSDEAAAFEALTAALAQFPPRPPHPRSDYNKVVESATDILRGESPPEIAELKELVKGLKALKKFGVARRLLEKIRPLPVYNQNITSVDRLWMRQQHALCTYKDPDLPADKKFDSAIAILGEPDELATTSNQETLGIAGAIYKYRYEALGQKSDPERSLSYYLRGHEAGLRNDYGYTSINAAFVLDLLARQEADDAGQAGTVSQTAEDRRAHARTIRSELIDVLPPMQHEPDNRFLAGKWWFLVTVAEAFFGLGRFDVALYWLQKGIAREVVVEPWEFESTAANLRALYAYKRRATGTRRRWSTRRPGPQ